MLAIVIASEYSKMHKQTRKKSGFCRFFHKVTEGTARRGSDGQAS